MREFVEKLYVTVTSILEGSYYKSVSMGDVYRWIHIYRYAMNMIDWVFVSLLAIMALIIVIKCTKEETH